MCRQAYSGPRHNFLSTQLQAPVLVTAALMAAIGMVLSLLKAIHYTQLLVLPQFCSAQNGHRITIARAYALAYLCVWYFIVWFGLDFLDHI